jgi:hypothetical protein
VVQGLGFVFGFAFGVSAVPSNLISAVRFLNSAGGTQFAFIRGCLLPNALRLFD